MFSNSNDLPVPLSLWRKFRFRVHRLRLRLGVFRWKNYCHLTHRRRFHHDPFDGRLKAVWAVRWLNDGGAIDRKSFLWDFAAIRHIRRCIRLGERP